LKICTFNVNSIRARKDLIFSWLEHRHHDIEILLFQELKSVSENFPYQDFENYGYNCQVSGQKGYNGVAICSKLPQKRILQDYISQHLDEQKRVIVSEIKRITLINIYAPRGDLRDTPHFNYKLDWYDKFLTFLHQNFSPQTYLIIAGDFNVAREDIDVWDSDILKDSIGTMPEERQAFTKLLTWGLFDCYRYLYPQQQQFTWWDYIGGAIWQDKGMRIDYIVCTKPLLEKLDKVEVDLWPRRRRTPTPSDHAPSIATFNLNLK